MAMSKYYLIVYLTAIAVLISAVAAQTPAPAATKYVNHTVGGAAGWFFNATTNTASGKYSSWAATQTFNLGDYLIFNTNTNQTVIQTYNKTTYKSCSIDDTDDDDFFQYGGSEKLGEATTISVPLTIEGPNYYFSTASDGVQCKHGLSFEIVVNHGLGLPPSLKQSPPPPYTAPPPSVLDQVQSPPVTVTVEKPSGGGVRAGGDNSCWVLICGVVVVFSYFSL